LAGLTRETMASYSQAEDLINVGAYVKGSNPKIDFSIEKIDAINQFLRQGIFENVGMEQSLQILEHIFAE